MGGWWVEPDRNLPSGESFARHALYGLRFFRDTLGAQATVGFNPDAFEHNAMLPQILRRSGIYSYVFMRPQIHERDMPRLFWWESPDGSRVLAYRVIGKHDSPAGTLDDQVGLCLPSLAGHTPDYSASTGSATTEADRPRPISRACTSSTNGRTS